MIAPLLGGCGTGSGAGVAGPTAMELPGVSLTLEEETFTVTGSTVAEIGESLRRLSPYLRGRSVRGIHGYQISWRYSLRPSDGACRVEDVQVDLSSKVTLPRWRRSGGAAFELEELWGAYLQDIRDHEDTHRSLAIQAALTIQHDLAALEAPTCSSQLRTRANARAGEILEEFRERNRAFDRSSAGVRWPPYDRRAWIERRPLTEARITLLHPDGSELDQDPVRPRRGE